MQVTSSKSASLLLAVLLIYNGSGLTQTLPPPSGGSGPSNGGNSGILLPVAGGLAIGAAAYYLLKGKPKKVPVNIRIDDFLWEHNILPTTDAVKIMYAINPAIRNMEMISIKHKLELPDLPELPEVDLSSATEDPLPLLNDQFVLFKTRRDAYQKKFPNDAGLNKHLTESEKEILSYIQNTKDIDPDKSGLIIDLITVLNQTLKEVLSGNVKTGSESKLLEDICQNISEIISPVTNKTENSGGKSMGYLKPGKSGQFYVFANCSSTNWYGIASENSFKLPELKQKRRLPPDVSKFFAIAVCKIRKDGTPITKGPEVEKQFTVKYVCPALRERENSYTTLRDPATWASARLYPAKYYFEVLVGPNKLSIQEPLIDILNIYRNKKPGKPNEAIRILINVYE